MLCELGGCVGVLALLRDTGKAVRTNSRGRSPGLAKFRTNQKVPIRSRGLERAGTERSNRS
jgi:hypothetical protein